MPAKTIVETSGLTKSYGLVKALNNISLKVPEGATGLLGPNGAGKSTLIRSLIGLVRPTVGTGTIFGHNITTEGIEIRKRIGYMPEHECLVRDMKAIELVAYVGLISGMSRSDSMQRAHEVLHFVGLGDERYRRIDTFSTGMKQKVNLAQALVHDPDLLFLDEPTNGLDPRGRVEMLELIKFLAHDKGKSVILSSHILPDVEYVCDNIVVLAAGEVLLQGGIKEQLRGEVGVVNVRTVGDTAAFMKAVADIGYRAVDVEGYMVRVTAQGSAEVNEERMFSDVMRAAAKAGVQVRFASRSSMNLEDLFIEIVERKGRENMSGERQGGAR